MKVCSFEAKMASKKSCPKSPKIRQWMCEMRPCVLREYQSWLSIRCSDLSGSSASGA